mmetsp:Transcript_9202/g.17575  ORF Transcript_9202/g.17575 Transcript_9202/m.17575 type:complete len:440 (-) Transcript_9202:1352-2671(-)
MDTLLFAPPASRESPSSLSRALLPMAEGRSPASNGDPPPLAPIAGDAPALALPGLRRPPGVPSFDEEPGVRRPPTPLRRRAESPMPNLNFRRLFAEVGVVLGGVCAGGRRFGEIAALLPECGVGGWMDGRMILMGGGTFRFFLAPSAGEFAESPSTAFVSFFTGCFESDDDDGTGSDEDRNFSVLDADTTDLGSEDLGSGSCTSSSSFSGLSDVAPWSPTLVSGCTDSLGSGLASWALSFGTVVSPSALGSLPSDSVTSDGDGDSIFRSTSGFLDSDVGSWADPEEGCSSLGAFSSSIGSICSSSFTSSPFVIVVPSFTSLSLTFSDCVSSGSRVSFPSFVVSGFTVSFPSFVEDSGACAAFCNSLVGSGSASVAASPLLPSLPTHSSSLTLSDAEGLGLNVGICAYDPWRLSAESPSTASMLTPGFTYPRSLLPRVAP